jgi:hypothetical protein
MRDDLRGRFRTALDSGIDGLETRRRERPRELWRAALRLEHVILSDVLTAEEEADVLAGMDPARVQVCQDIFCGLETVIENSFAALALDGGEGLILESDRISENYLARYEELARREVALAGIGPGDRVLFVGSGPFPITAIEYCRQTGCRADCADFVPEAIATSREVLRRLSLDGRIRCHQARGEELPASEYSVVLVGVLARPKREIFRNLEATAPAGCRIIARTTFGLRQLIYPAIAIDESRLPGIRRRGESEARGDQVISSYLYTLE